MSRHDLLMELIRFNIRIDVFGHRILKTWVLVFNDFPHVQRQCFTIIIVSVQIALLILNILSLNTIGLDNNILCRRLQILIFYDIGKSNPVKK